MKKSITLLLTVLFAFSAFAISGCSKDPSDPEDHKAFGEEMKETILDNKDDCDAMGDELMALFEDNEDFLKEGAKARKEDPDKFKGDEDDDEKVDDAIMECIENEKVQKAFEKFGELTKVD